MCRIKIDKYDIYRQLLYIIARNTILHLFESSEVFVVFLDYMCNCVYVCDDCGCYNFFINEITPFNIKDKDKVNKVLTLLYVFWIAFINGEFGERCMIVYALKFNHNHKCIYLNRFLDVYS